MFKYLLRNSWYCLGIKFPVKEMGTLVIVRDAINILDFSDGGNIFFVEEWKAGWQIFSIYLWKKRKRQ